MTTQEFDMSAELVGATGVAVLAPFAVDPAVCFRADEQRVVSSAVSRSDTETTT